MLFSITLSSQNKMPNVILKTIEGKTVNSKSTSNKNGLTIYSFWATWCVPCINELDAINKDFDKWKLETNVKLVAVSTDDARTKRRVS
jgi:peroxiredoxin